MEINKDLIVVSANKDESIIIKVKHKMIRALDDQMLHVLTTTRDLNYCIINEDVSYEEDGVFVLKATENPIFWTIENLKTRQISYDDGD